MYPIMCPIIEPRIQPLKNKILYFRLATRKRKPESLFDSQAFL
nr:MAG TPA: hypothetical protein [Caudoviricetes sp.]